MGESVDPLSARFVRETVLGSGSSFVIGLHLYASFGVDFHNTVFSGIVVEVDGHNLWVSSGHCIDIIRAALSADDMFSWNAGLLDGYDDYPAVRLPVLLTLDRLIGGDSGDIDIGAIRLSSFTMNGLAHNENFRLAPIDPTPQVLNDGDSLYLLGYQASFNSPDLMNVESTTNPEGVRVNRLTFHLVPAVSGIPIQPASDESSRASFAVHRDAPTFDLLLGDLVFPDIGGMSGGPLVRLSSCSTGTPALSVFAIQSEWNRRSRVIRADRIDAALEYLRSTLSNSSIEPLP